MKGCEQFPGMNVLEHGHDVHKWFIDVYDHLVYKSPLRLKWRMPSWVLMIKEEDLAEFDVLKDYHIYHDCGKPFCRIEDDKGVHFPNHAAVSKEVWLRHFPGEVEVGSLIGMDMDAHTMKSDQIGEFIKRKECASLLITALCEIHSNAMMKDGIDSTSFKIKWKRIDRIGKRYVKARM